MISKEYIRGFLKTAQEYSAWAGAVRGNNLGPAAQMLQGRRGHMYDPRISDLVGNGRAMRPFAEMLQRRDPGYRGLTRNNAVGTGFANTVRSGTYGGPLGAFNSGASRVGKWIGGMFRRG